jgi:putative transposase
MCCGNWREVDVEEIAGPEAGAPKMTPRTKREHLRELVAAKNRWNRPLTEKETALGFLGWHERGFLPHCDYPGMTQLVTFRLEDSMPASRRREWEGLLKIESNREKRKKLEEYLDRGFGNCFLRDSRVAKLMEETLLHFHGEQYELLGWCVMPNHVHVLVEVWQTPLWKMVRSWKQFAAKGAERILTERRPPARRKESELGKLRKQLLKWEREYWDTFMRDESQEKTAILYIENNPTKARLCRSPEDWKFSSARLRDQYRRLVLPENIVRRSSSTRECADDCAVPEAGAPSKHSARWHSHGGAASPIAK